MTVIKQEDVVQSIADALQYISYYHPTDFIRAMRQAWEQEESPAAKAARPPFRRRTTSDAR